jgi:O-antigen ligase
MDRIANSVSKNNDNTPSEDRFLFWSFLTLIIWIPLPLGSNRVWAGSLLSIATVTLVTVWCLLWSRKKVQLNPVFKKTWPVLAMLILSNLWVGYQLSPFGYTISIANTWHEFTLGWGLIAFFSLAILLLNTKKRLRITLYVIVISGLFQAIYGSLMTLTGVEYSFLIPKDSYIGLASGTFVNKNHFAAYLVVCLSLGIGLMIATLKSSPSGTWRNRLRRWLTAILGGKARLRIALIIIVIGIVLTHSRMGNTSFFAAMLITGIIALILSRHATRSTVILLSSLLVIDILIVGTFFGVEKVVDRLEQTSSYRETRDEVDIYSLKLLNKHLLDGTGAGTFYTSFTEYRGADIPRFYDHAHNDYLEILSERGIVGFTPLIVAWILCFVASLFAQWKRKDPLMRGLSFGCIMSMIAMAMHATVEFNFQIPANAAMYLLVLAFALISFFHKDKKRRQKTIY